MLLDAATGGRLFQHTAARRRLEPIWRGSATNMRFQHTAARRRLAIRILLRKARYCFNTQPPEGGWLPCKTATLWPMCFNTQPPEGGWHKRQLVGIEQAGFNTQPPEGGWWQQGQDYLARRKFQHTAARRRLVLPMLGWAYIRASFNTQPPEGGWYPTLQAGSYT